MRQDKKPFWESGVHPILGAHLEKQTKQAVERLNKTEVRTTKTNWR